MVEQVVALLVEQVAEPQVADMLIVLMVVEQLVVGMPVVALVAPFVAFQQ